MIWSWVCPYVGLCAVGVWLNLSKSYKQYARSSLPPSIRPSPPWIHVTRVRDVLASRACRTSIMIGSPLTRQQQGRILARLAQLDAPFNCPHGRPTMRHLAVLPVEQQQEEQQPETAAE